jgi:flagellum-specific peptidoglycan hydrolase FlgJ
MNRKIFLLTGLLLLGTTTIKAQEKLVQDKTQESVSKKGLYEQIIKYGIKFPDIVFAQAMIESGELTSKLFKSSNNMFGMKFPSVRETTAHGKTKSGYSRYEDWNFGVYDYFLWQDHMLRNRNEMTRSQYLSLLGRVYAEDPNYVNKVKKKVSQYKHIF